MREAAKHLADYQRARGAVRIGPDGPVLSSVEAISTRLTLAGSILCQLHEHPLLREPVPLRMGESKLVSSVFAELREAFLCVWSEADPRGSGVPDVQLASPGAVARMKDAA